MNPLRNLLAAILVSAAPLSFAADDKEQKLSAPFDAVFKTGRTQVVHIYHDSSICAGVVVTPRLVITAWHCVDKMRAIHVRFDESSKLKTDDYVKIVAIDKNTDLAVLKLSRDFDLQPARFADSAAKDGEQILVVGHPLAKLYQATRGTVVQPEERFFLTSAAIAPGNSGGPVFNAKGELVGNVSRKNSLFGGRFLGDCAALKPMKDILAKAELNSHPPRTFEAEGDGLFTLGLLWDPYLDKMNGESATHITYRIGLDISDRVRLAWRHSILRPERVRSGEISWIFRFGHPQAGNWKLLPVGVETFMHCRAKRPQPIN